MSGDQLFGVLIYIALPYLKKQEMNSYYACKCNKKYKI